MYKYLVIHMWVPDLLGYVYAYKHTSMIVLNNIGSDIALFSDSNKQLHDPINLNIFN